MRQVRQLAARADTSDIDGWWDRSAPQIIRLVTRSFDLMRALTTRYLRRHGAVEGFHIVPVGAEANRDQIETSLRVTGPVEFKRHMRDTGSPDASRRTMETTLTGATQRLVLAGDRETTNATIDASDVIVGYRRVTGGSPCAFCAMLASRGAVYKSERSATRVVGVSGRARGSRQIGNEYHDHCRCSVLPLYEHEDEPSSVVALRERWDESTAGLSGKAALRAFRRALTEV